MFNRLQRSFVAGATALALIASTGHAEELDIESLSMAQLLGVIFAMNSNLDEIGFDADEKRAFVDAYAQVALNPSLIDTDAVESRMGEVQAFVQERLAVIEQTASARQQEMDAAFLAELLTSDDIAVDESGFYYEIIDRGGDVTPGADADVTVHYQGSLTDGTVFDSSYLRGEPVTFPMDGVIPGFSGGLSKIGEGGKVRIYIPSELGYGSTPPPGSQIPGDAMLIFEAELISID